MKLNKLIKLEKVVKEILENDELARKDDNYLIFRVVQAINPDIAGTTFANAMFGAKK